MPARRHDHGRSRGPRILIWAYGSNLDPDQMAARCPDARIVGPAYLQNHELRFRGRSWSWGGAVAAVSPARGLTVPGVLYQVSARDLATLDRCEGHPLVYRRQTVDVIADGHVIRAQAYVMRRGPRPGAPSVEYFRAIYRGYVVWGLPVRVLTAAVRIGRQRYRQPRARAERNAELW
jgi:gamma-glutamylcyclotransferase (GGCT)/AIG2-like uncharacterized protein YtfP